MTSFTVILCPALQYLFKNVFLEFDKHFYGCLGEGIVQVRTKTKHLMTISCNTKKKKKNSPADKDEDKKHKHLICFTLILPMLCTQIITASCHLSLPRNSQHPSRGHKLRCRVLAYQEKCVCPVSAQTITLISHIP